MGWGKGDNSKANTISDNEWSSIQSRARAANQHRSADDTRRGRDSLRQAERGNN